MLLSVCLIVILTFTTISLAENAPQMQDTLPMGAKATCEEPCWMGMIECERQGEASDYCFEQWRLCLEGCRIEYKLFRGALRLFIVNLID